MSAAKKGRKTGPKTPETRARISAATKGRTFSAEARSRMSETHKKRNADPKLRARISAALKGRKLSPETLAKRSSTCKAKKSRPEKNQGVFGFMD